MRAWSVSRATSTASSPASSARSATATTTSDGRASSEYKQVVIHRSGGENEVLLGALGFSVLPHFYSLKSGIWAAFFAPRIQSPRGIPKWRRPPRWSGSSPPPPRRGRIASAPTPSRTAAVKCRGIFSRTLGGHWRPLKEKLFLYLNK